MNTHRRWIILSTIMTLALVAGIVGLRPAAAAPAPVRQEAGRPVIIDTDMALDDWIAILYLLQRPDLDVQALTVAGTGEAHCKPGIQNAQHLLALGGHPKIPVACGRETPLQGTHVFPLEWRDSMDAMLGLPLPANPTPLPEMTAVDLIASILKDSSQPVTLVTLGPLTNIGELLEAQPTLIDRLHMIYIMGGALNVPGNLLGYVDNTVAEWNIYVDPHAAHLVLASGAPVTLVPLDVTNTVPITWDFYHSLQHDRRTQPAEFVFKVLSKNRWFLRSGGYYFWDPLAAAVASDESLVAIEQQTIRVVEDEGPESGRTVIAPEGSVVSVATSADTGRFTATLINVLNRRAADAPLQPVAVTPEEMQANKAIVRRWYEEAWGRGDRLTAEALVSGDYVIHVNADLLNLAQIEDTIRQLHVGLPDLEASIETPIAEGDWVAAMVTLHGTHTGTDTAGVFAIPPTGNEVTIRANVIVYLVDGKVVEEWMTVDMLGLMTQIGALPSP
jgi:inosine-uridine nucleoside N-ribohydrolase/predicted ester cyclase